MTAAKGRKTAKKGAGAATGKALKPAKAPARKAGNVTAKSSKAKQSQDSQTSIELLFKEIGQRMKALSADDPGEAGAAFDYTGTIGLLDQVLVMEPGNRNAFIYKGIMLMGMGEQEKALECFNAILKANPGDSEALNNKAIALYGLGKADEAMAYVDKALEIDRRYADALMNKAVMLYHKGDAEEARKYLARANACDTLRP